MACISSATLGPCEDQQWAVDLPSGRIMDQRRNRNWTRSWGSTHPATKTALEAFCSLRFRRFCCKAMIVTENDQNDLQYHASFLAMLVKHSVGLACRQISGRPPQPIRWPGRQAGAVAECGRSRSRKPPLTPTVLPPRLPMPATS